MEKPSNCSSCGAALTDGAVLCVACGYHIQLDRHLATSVEDHTPASPTPDANPYASPQSEAHSELAGEPEGELPPAIVKQAEAVVFAAETLRGALLMVCCCAPLWYALLPYYGFQLWRWFQLNGNYQTLAEPNSFSPHGELAVRFQEARIRLIAGVIVGLILCGLLALGYAVRILEKS